MSEPAGRATLAVLVGGKSRRMGRDKAHLHLGGSTVLERVLAAAAPLGLPMSLIGDAAGPVGRLGLPVWPDLQPAAGPLGGLQAALTASRCDRVLFLACDLPFLSTAFLRFLLAQSGGRQALVPRSARGLEPLCAVYERSCLPAVERALDRGDRRIVAFYPEVDLRVLEPAEWADLDPRGRLLTNLNTPEEYQQALAWVREEEAAAQVPAAAEPAPASAGPATPSRSQPRSW